MHAERLPRKCTRQLTTWNPTEGKSREGIVGGMADSVSLLLCLRTSHIHMSIRRRRGRSPKFLVCQGVYLCDISKETRGDESYDTFPMSLSSKARRVRHFSRRYGSPDDWFLLMSPRRAKMSYVACVRRPSKPYSSEDTQGCRMSKKRLRLSHPWSESGYSCCDHGTRCRWASWAQPVAVRCSETVLNDR